MCATMRPSASRRPHVRHRRSTICRPQLARAARRERAASRTRSGHRRRGRARAAQPRRLVARAPVGALHRRRRRSSCPVSIVGAWARVQLVDEDAFVATLAPLVDDPAVQAMIIDESMEAITAQVDFQQTHRRACSTASPASACRRARRDALQLLQAPAANGLESLVTTTVTRVVESDAFSEVWATATRAAHRALVRRGDLRRRRARRPHRRGRRHPARRRRRARQAEPRRSRPRRRAS